MKNYKLLILFIISVILNIIFFKADIMPLIKRQYLKQTTSFLAKEIPEGEFSQILLSGTLKNLNSEFTAGEDLILHRDVRASVFRTEYDVQEFGEYGYLIWSALRVSNFKKDHYTKQLIKDKFDKFFFSNSDFKIERSDQSIYGCIAIDLFNETNDNKYKYFADQIYNYLKNSINSYGVIPYKKKSLYQDVDILGFVVPFLIYYSDTFNNLSAKDHCIKLMEEYIKYGVDNKTGLPSQGYNFENKIKLGYSNWSRGFAWYALALSAIDYELLSENSKNKITLFEKTIFKLFTKEMIFNQFYGQKQTYNVDMSATLPILYFLIKKNMIMMNKMEFINYYSNYVMANGQVGYNSAGIQYKERGSTMPYMRHDLSQGMMFLIFETLL